MTSACSKSSMPSDLALMDPDGDINLKVGTTKCLGDASKEHRHRPPVIYRCCSRTLSRSSPIFKAIVDAAGKTLSETHVITPQFWTVCFLKEDPASMGFLLNIMHGRFADNPSIDSKFTTRQIYDLVRLADKFDLTSLLRPWIKDISNLVAERQGLADSYGSKRRLDQELWIAWCVGDKCLLDRALVDLTLGVEVNTSTGAVRTTDMSPDANLFTDVPAPADLLDIIKERRSRVIEDLLSPFRKIVSRFLDSDFYASQCCHSWTDPLSRSKCHLVMFGSLIRSLRAAGLYPVPSHLTYEGSAKELAKSLRALKLENLSSKPDPADCLHASETVTRSSASSPGTDTSSNTQYSLQHSAATTSSLISTPLSEAPASLPDDNVPQSSTEMRASHVNAGNVTSDGYLEPSPIFHKDDMKGRQHAPPFTPRRIIFPRTKKRADSLFHGDPHQNCSALPGIQATIDFIVSSAKDGQLSASSLKHIRDRAFVTGISTKPLAVDSAVLSGA